jgi:cell cycle sensor histidine kinase DivJ
VSCWPASVSPVSGCWGFAQTIAQDPAVLALLGSISALVYAGGLAVSVQIVHKQSEETIRQGERRYRLLAENATDMITRHDAGGKVVFASLAAKQLLGVNAQSLFGDRFFERIHVADRPAYLAALNQCITGNGQSSVEFRARSKRSGRDSDAAENDEFVWMEMRCRPVGSVEQNGGVRMNSVDQIVAVTRDITDRKLHEGEVLKARDAAESASRAKTQFLANMSHELRTPLNAIIGFSEILTRELFGTLGDERYNEYSRLIYESGEHLLNVVNEILDMSKIEAGKFTIVAEHFDVGELVTSCCQIMTHQAEQKKIHLEMKVADKLPELVADKRACKQMLLNLLSNAIKFTDEGGHVSVSASCVGDTMEIAVADSGIGISEQDLPKLGNPFVQAEASYDRNYEGTGLGLSVVKGLARLHGGSLDIQSEPGTGTVVTIRLPVEGAADEAEPVQPDEQSTVSRIAIGA